MKEDGTLEPQDYWTIKYVHEMTMIPTRTIQNWAKKRLFKVKKEGRQWMINAISYLMFEKRHFNY